SASAGYAAARLGPSALGLHRLMRPCRRGETRLTMDHQAGGRALPCPGGSNTSACRGGFSRGPHTAAICGAWLPLEPDDFLLRNELLRLVVCGYADNAPVNFDFDLDAFLLRNDSEAADFRLLNGGSGCHLAPPFHSTFLCRSSS